MGVRKTPSRPKIVLKMVTKMEKLQEKIKLKIKNGNKNRKFSEKKSLGFQSDDLNARTAERYENFMQ